MIQRHLAPVLKKAARDYPVVTVTGPRQSGKTTLVRAVFPKHRYVSLEDPDQRRHALEDPRGFLDQFKRGGILDEVQRAPELFSYIQGIVDDQDRAGQFILSGSQNFLLLNRVTQSLAGRCAILKLLPLSWSELQARRASNLIDLVKPSRTIQSTASSRSLFQVLQQGGYPRIHDRDLQAGDWLANYYQSYLERDVRDLLNIGDIETFGRFVRLCAGRSGQLLNASSLAVDAGITHTTARRWLSLLEASYIIFLLRPHHRNYNKRLIKSPKLYFHDTGLLCYLLQIRSPEALETHAGRGAVFETWVVSEALKNCLNRGIEPFIYFWRDLGGHEIDMLLEDGESLIPVEIKSGQTIATDFFSEIEFWKNLTGQHKAAGLVFGGSTTHVRQGVSVISWNDWG